MLKIILALAGLLAIQTAPFVSAAEGDALRVSESGHWLEYRGRTILLVGDSVTQGWMELGENFDQAAYVQALTKRGVNVLSLWSYIAASEWYGPFGRIGYVPPTIWPWAKRQRTGWNYVRGLLPWFPRHDVFDLATLNDEYFARLRSLVELAHRNNIIVLITVHDGWPKRRFKGHPFNVGNGGPLDEARQYVELADYDAEMPPSFKSTWDRRQKNQYFLERFSERLIRATADFPNVAYEIFNEGEWYDQKDLRAFQIHFLNFFRTRTDRLLIINDDHVAGKDFQTEVNADVLSNHRPIWNANTAARQAYAHYSSRFARTPAKPYFFTEPVPGYSGQQTMLEGLMRLMWGTAMAGASFVIQNDTSFGFDPNATIADRAVERDLALDLEGYCARFFNSEIDNLAAMRPASTQCSTSVCLVNPGKEYVVYSQDGAEFTVDLSATNLELVGRFYDPREGRFAPSFTVMGGSPAQVFATPSIGDWVLHLRTQK